MFTDYRVQSNSNNEVTITVASEALLAALRSAAGPSSTKETNKPFSNEETEIIMKYARLDVRKCLLTVVTRLAKNHDKKSVMNFEITRTTALGRSMTIVQQLLIDVLRHGEVARLVEPKCPEPDVSRV